MTIRYDVTCTGSRDRRRQVCDLPAAHFRSRCMTELGAFFDADPDTLTYDLTEGGHAQLNAALAIADDDAQTALLTEPADLGPNADDDPSPHPELPLEVTAGLTITGPWGGAQIRCYNGLANPDLIGTDHPDAYATTPAETFLAVALNPDTPLEGDATNTHPVYRLTAEDARALRDLLNIATARNYL